MSETNKQSKTGQGSANLSRKKRTGSATKESTNEITNVIPSATGEIPDEQAKDNRIPGTSPTMDQSEHHETDPQKEIRVFLKLADLFPADSTTNTDNCEIQRLTILCRKFEQMIEISQRFLQYAWKSDTLIFTKVVCPYISAYMNLEARLAAFEIINNRISFNAAIAEKRGQIEQLRAFYQFTLKVITPYVYPEDSKDQKVNQTASLIDGYDLKQYLLDFAEIFCSSVRPGLDEYKCLYILYAKILRAVKLLKFFEEFKWCEDFEIVQNVTFRYFTEGNRPKKGKNITNSRITRRIAFNTHILSRKELITQFLDLYDQHLKYIRQVVGDKDLPKDIEIEENETQEENEELDKENEGQENPKLD